MSGMTWADWSYSEYNPYNWDNVLSTNSVFDIYAWYDDEHGENSIVTVDYYEWWIGDPEPTMIDSYNLAINGVESRAKDVIIEGAVYSRYS